MNGVERVRTAFAHKEVDWLPIFEWTIDHLTAAFVLCRLTLCGFGGRMQGLLQNQAFSKSNYELPDG
jgi:hypothetical protein